MFNFIKKWLTPDTKVSKTVSFPREAFLSFPGYSINAETCYNIIAAELTARGICSGWTLVGALATIRVEVGKQFLPIPEYASGQEYEGRRDLGNIYPGDGPRFKGRGYIQLTGRSNYQKYGDTLGINLVNNPDLALDPHTAAKILALYFENTKAFIACDNNDWVKVRQLVNGGNGIDVEEGGTTYNLDLFKNIINQYSQKTIPVNIPKMETVTILYTFKPVDKTYVIYQTAKDDGAKDTGVWTSETDLATNDEILAFAKTHVDAGIEVVIA